VLLKREIVPALPSEGQNGGTYWFNKKFRELGEKGAEDWGIFWLRVNTWVRDAVSSADMIPSNPVIRWMCYVIAYKVCKELRACPWCHRTMHDGTFNYQEDETGAYGAVMTYQCECGGAVKEWRYAPPEEDG